MHLLALVKGICFRLFRDIKDYRWIIVTFILWNVIVRSLFHAFCPVLIIFGIPCAGCGMTRAIWFVLTGQFERGIRLNPTAPLWIIFLGYMIFVRYVLGKKIKGVYKILGGVVVISFGVYIYRMVSVFPGEPPMVFHYKCILEYLFPGYIAKIKAVIG